MPGHPTNHPRAVFVGNVVADVVPLGIEQQRRVRRFADDPLRLLRRGEPILAAVDDEQRARYVLQDTAERKRLRSLECLSLVMRLRVQDVAAFGQRVELWPSLVE